MSRKHEVAIAFPAGIKNNAASLIELLHLHQQIQSDSFIRLLSKCMQKHTNGDRLMQLVEIAGILGELEDAQRVKLLSSPQSYAWCTLAEEMFADNSEISKPVQSALNRLGFDRQSCMRWLIDELGLFLAAAMVMANRNRELENTYKIHSSQLLPDTRYIIKKSTFQLFLAGFEQGLLNKEGKKIGIRKSLEFRKIPVLEQDSIPTVLNCFATNGISSSKEETAEWVAVLNQALKKIRQWRPEFATVVPAALRIVIPWPSKSKKWYPSILVDQYLPSGSIGFIPGLCWLTAGENPYLNAEGLIHEVAHQILHHLEEHLPIVADEHALLHSPWQPKPRSVRGVIHGFFVFSHVLEFWKSVLREADISGQTSEYAKGRIEFLTIQLKIAKKELQGKVLTEEGISIVEQISTHLLKPAAQSSVSSTIEEILQMRRQRQFSKHFEKDLLNLRAMVLEWVDTQIISTNRCPYALPGLRQQEIQVAFFSHETVADLFYDLAKQVTTFLEELQLNSRLCLICIFPKILDDQVPLLTGLKVEDLLALLNQTSDAILGLKTRFFDPQDPGSDKAPFVSWVLRKALPHEV